MSDDSVVRLMRTIEATPAVEQSTRTYAGLLADKLQGRDAPLDFGSMFEEILRNGRDRRPL